MREASEASDEVAIGYGELMEVLIDFLIISFTIFVIIKFINRFKTKSENPKDKTVETPKNIQLLSNIEKLLEEQNSYIKNKGAKD